MRGYRITNTKTGESRDFDKHQLLDRLTNGRIPYGNDNIPSEWPEHSDNDEGSEWDEADPFDLWHAFDLGDGSYTIEETT